MRRFFCAMALAVALAMALTVPTLAAGPGLDGLGRCPHHPGKDGHNHVPTQAYNAAGGSTAIVFCEVSVP